MRDHLAAPPWAAAHVHRFAGQEEAGEPSAAQSGLGLETVHAPVHGHLRTELPPRILLG